MVVLPLDQYLSFPSLTSSFTIFLGRHHLDFGDGLAKVVKIEFGLLLLFYPLNNFLLCFFAHSFALLLVAFV